MTLLITQFLQRGIDVIFERGRYPGSDTVQH